MPASSGLRSRPQIGMMRSISAHRLQVSDVAQIVPKVMILPIAFAAMVTVAVVSVWTYGIHTDSALAAADETISTGSFTKSN